MKMQREVNVDITQGLYQIRKYHTAGKSNQEHLLKNTPNS